MGNQKNIRGTMPIDTTDETFMNKGSSEQLDRNSIRRRLVSVGGVLVRYFKPNSTLSQTSGVP